MQFYPATQQRSDMDWRERYLNKVTCCDCLEAMKELPDKCVDAVVTDIPYNISQQSNGLRNLDYGEWDKQYGMENTWAREIARVVKQTAIVFCGKSQFSHIENIFTDSGMTTRTIVWHKSNPTVMNCDKVYIEATELAVYGKKPNGTYNPNYKHNVFDSDNAPRERVHPTQKPLVLFEEFICDTTRPTDIILDPFLGSGTTAVAAIRTGRQFIGFEIDPHYCDIANRRIADELAQVKIPFDEPIAPVQESIF
jgi:DNA modification methylase